MVDFIIVSGDLPVGTQQLSFLTLLNGQSERMVTSERASSYQFCRSQRIIPNYP